MMEEKTINMKEVRAKFTDVFKAVDTNHDVYKVERYQKSVYIVNEELFDVLSFLDKEGKLEGLVEGVKAVTSIEEK